MSSHPITRRLARRIQEESGQPAAHVIAEDVWLAVVEGSLSSGERLPTARELAIGLGVSPRTVQRAYEELERLGVATTRVGQGTFVSLHPPSGEERERRRAFRALCREILEQAEALGFTLEELLDALAEFRTASRASSPGEAP